MTTRKDDEPIPDDEEQPEAPNNNIVLDQENGEEDVSLIVNNNNRSPDIDQGDVARPRTLLGCNRKNLLWISGLTFALESMTCFMRFGLDLQSTRDTASMARYTFRLRIHHGYVGVVLVLLAMKCFTRRPSVQVCLFRFGWSLILSDAIHHFLVLWPTTGSPQFDIFYPKSE